MVFECIPCSFATFDRSNFNKHLLTTKHKKVTGEEPSFGAKYECVSCDFSTKDKKDFSRHIQTQKHKRLTATAKIEKENFCALCNFQAKTPKGFASHKETKKHKELLENKTCIGEEKIRELSQKISFLPSDKDIVLYFEGCKTNNGKTFVNATISYVVTTTNVRDELTLFEVFSSIFVFLGVSVIETQDRTFLISWRRKKYEISRKKFLFFVASTVASFDDRCKVLINKLYDSFRKERRCVEPLKDKKYEVDGKFLSLRNARNEKTGDYIVILASSDGLIKFSEEMFKIFQRLKKKAKRKALTEGFCIWWKLGKKFNQDVEKCQRECLFFERKSPCTEHTIQKEVETDSEEEVPEYCVLRHVTETQYISFLENFRMSPSNEVCDDARAVVFIEKAMGSIVKESPQNTSSFDTQVSFFSAILEKKEEVRRNITLSFFGFEPRTNFSLSVVEAIRKLQE